MVMSPMEVSFCLSSRRSAEYHSKSVAGVEDICFGADWVNQTRGLEVVGR